jgi:hypothetical protein
VTTADDGQAGPRPVLAGRRVTLRPGRAGGAPRLRAILTEPSVSRWWAEPDPVDVIEKELRGDGRFHDGLLMDLLRDELAPEPLTREGVP